MNLAYADYRSSQLASSLSTSALPATSLRELGHVFTRIRRARQMTRAHLAKKLGVSPAYIREIENGRKRPSPATFAELAEGLGISLVVALAFLKGCGQRIVAAAGSPRRDGAESPQPRRRSTRRVPVAWQPSHVRFKARYDLQVATTRAVVS